MKKLQIYNYNYISDDSFKCKLLNEIDPKLQFATFKLQAWPAEKTVNKYIV